MNEQTKAVETGWRGSLEGWLDAAYESLTECGVDTVRVMPLAKKLGLSRTSFYWFFKDREELLAALIDRWRVKNTGNLVAQTECYAESIAEAMLNVFDCWLNPDLFDSQFEFAMRSWALQSAEVAEHIRVADIARREALIRMFVRFDYDIRRRRCAGSNDLPDADWLHQHQHPRGCRGTNAADSRVREDFHRPGTPGARVETLLRPPWVRDG